MGQVIVRVSPTRLCFFREMSCALRRVPHEVDRELRENRDGRLVYLQASTMIADAFL